MTESPYPLVPVDEAQSRVLARVGPLPPQPVPLTQSAGLVAAVAIVASELMPPFAASAVDGYAVVAADGTGMLEVTGEVSAGAISAVAVAPGKAARIATGAAVPPGADAVVMVERTVSHNGRVEIQAAVEPGAGIRPAGMDYGPGDTLVERGSVMNPARIGLAASAGVTLIEAVPRPRVVVLSTGDELVPVTSRPEAGQIRDSNRLALMAAVEEAGGIALDGGHVPDSEDATEALAMVTEAADVVVTSGGVSMGHRDLVKPWLAQVGEIVFGRVNMKPGKPATFGIVAGRPFFALPGFPVSALVTFELFVRPALKKLAGHSVTTRPVWAVSLDEDVRHDPVRVEFVRATVNMTGAGPRARVTGAQGSGRLLSLAGANALLRLEPSSVGLRAGATVSALVLGPVSGE